MGRHATFDIMKGIGILAVIAGHTVGSLTVDSVICKLIYSFHMPMFFIIAGYFFKANDLIVKKFLADFRRLVVPYLVTSLAFLVWQMITDPYFAYKCKYILIAIVWGTGENHTSYLWPTMPHIGAIWFLMALFWCRTMFNLLYCITIAKHKYVIIVTFAIAATLTDHYLINLPFGLLPGLSAMMYYLIGFLLRSHEPRRLFFLLCALCWIGHLLYSRIDMCICYYRWYPLDILGTTFGTILIYMVSKRLSSSAFCCKWIGLLGRVSLVVLCFHTLENNIIDYKECMFAGYSWGFVFVVRTTCCLLLTCIWYKGKNILQSLI